MVASVTHLVIGEQVLKTANYIPDSEETQGAFLSGCILVDLHAFQPVDRRTTHFVGRVEEDGEDAYRMSCSNYLAQAATLLKAPWGQLQPVGQAFAAGYLCHLAADECWKILGWQLFQKLSISDWADFPVPGDVSLTAFDYLASQVAPDFEDGCRCLAYIQFPDVFTHAAAEQFVRQWQIIRTYVLSGAKPEEYIRMLRLAGKPEGFVQAAEQRHNQTFDKTVAWYQKEGYVQPYIHKSVARSLEVLPSLCCAASSRSE